MKEKKPDENKLDSLWKMYKRRYKNYSLSGDIFLSIFFLFLVLINDAFVPHFFTFLAYSILLYVPYFSYLVIYTVIAKGWTKSIYRKKYEQGALILNGNFLFNFTVFSVILQVRSFFDLVQGFVLGTKAVKIAFVCYLIVNILIVVMVLTNFFGWQLPKIFKSVINSSRTVTYIMIIWFFGSFVLSFLLSTTRYLDEIGLKLFFLLTPLGLLLFFLSVENLSKFISVVRWRKRVSWDKNPTARRGGIYGMRKKRPAGEDAQT